MLIQIFRSLRNIYVLWYNERRLKRIEKSFDELLETLMEIEK